MPVTDPLWPYLPEYVLAALYDVAKRAALLVGESAGGGPLLPIHPLTRLARERNIDPTKPPRGKRPYSPQGRASPNNAPLVATGANARAIALLRNETVPGGIWTYWERDPHTRKFWGEILAQHQRGFQQTFYWPRGAKRGWKRTEMGPGFRNSFRKGLKPPGRIGNVPARDTLGLAPPRVAQVRAKVESRWRRMRPEVEKFIRLNSGSGLAGPHFRLPGERAPRTGTTRFDGPQRNRPNIQADGLSMPSPAGFVGMGVRELGRGVANTVRRIVMGLFR